MPDSRQTNQSQGVSTGSSTSGTQIVPGMLGLYNQMLGLQQRQYSNVLSAYGNGINAVGQQLPGIVQGYGNLLGDVRNTLGMGGGWGVATPAAQAIQRTYEQNRGQIAQQLTSAGLGNTTVSGNLQNQAAMQAAQAYGSLGAQLAQTYAGYQAQLGGAGLAARMQGLGQQVGLSQGLGNALAGYHFSNSVGPLLGNYSQSSNMSQQTSSGSSRAGGGYGGGGGGGSPTSGLSPQQLLGGGAHNVGGYGPGVGYSGGLQFNGLGGYGGYQPQGTPQQRQYTPDNPYFGVGADDLWNFADQPETDYFF